MNIDVARNILEQLAANGVRTLCLCPGARNAPFVALLEENDGFEIQSFYDERSAGFFALGRSRRDQTPVAILTTSGTAVSELLSSVIEAWYSNVPLIVLSSDRPWRLRGSGAPQTIDQSTLFEKHVEKCWDFEAGDPFELKMSGRKPVHINVCFDEPLIDQHINKFNKVEFSELVRTPFSVGDTPEKVSLTKTLAIVGGLQPYQRAIVARYLLETGIPVYAESLSGLKQDPTLQDQLILSGEKAVTQLLQSGEVRNVLRFGDIPVGRFWRDLDQLAIPTLSISDKEFEGTSQGDLVSFDHFEKNTNWLETPSWLWKEFKDWDRQQSQQILKLIEKFPNSEVAQISRLSTLIPAEDRVYLGNSLPVRLWDLVDKIHGDVFASRGVNGIDGQLSTAMGLWQKDQTLWSLLGDLTTLYDFSAFWLTPKLKEENANINAVVINNQGGQIFSRIFEQKLFRNEHSLNFDKIAEMWGWQYQRVANINDLKKTTGLNLIEILPSKDENHSFWQEYDQLWRQ